MNKQKSVEIKNKKKFKQLTNRNLFELTSNTGFAFYVEFLCTDSIFFLNNKIK